MRISDWSSDVCSSDLGALDDAGLVEGDDQHLAVHHLRLHEGDFLGLLTDVVPLAVLEGGYRRGRSQEIDDVLPALHARFDHGDVLGIGRIAAPDRTSTRLNSSHYSASRMPPSA